MESYFTINESGRHVLVNQQQYVIDVKNDMEVTLMAKENEFAKYLVILKGEGKLTLKVEVAKNGQHDLIVLHENHQPLIIDEAYYIAENAALNLHYGQFAFGNLELTSNYYLIGKLAKAEIHTASIVDHKIKWDQNVRHQVTDTNANVENYAVVFEQGDLSLSINGIIEEVAARSNSFQESRILNMAKNINSEVNPKLIIDNNDVAAGHAASVGQPDPDAIYYMQSRGLSKPEVLRIMTLGYLLPVVELIDNEDIKNSLSAKIIAKVDQL